MKDFFTSIWDKVKTYYGQARDYVANKLVQLRRHGAKLAATSNDTFSGWVQKVKGYLYQGVAYVAAFAFGFIIGYTIASIALAVGGVIGWALSLPFIFMLATDIEAAFNAAEVANAIADNLETLLFGLQGTANDSVAEEVAAA